MTNFEKFISTLTIEKALDYICGDCSECLFREECWKYNKTCGENCKALFLRWAATKFPEPAESGAGNDR
jgi:hypothetical protein